MTDVDVIKTGLVRNTYYKYKAELRKVGERVSMAFQN